jgi:hypothetical protein
VLKKLQALAIILLNRDLTPRPELTHSTVIMNTQCGYLRTAIGKPTRATVADLCSYFAQAAQSGTEEGPSGAYEAPMTVAQMRQRSIGNVLSNERVAVTLQSYYFTPTDSRQEKIARETVRQVVKNAQPGDDNQLELSQAVAAGGTHTQRNARITRAVARQRARAAAEAQHIESVFEVPSTSSAAAAPKGGAKKKIWLGKESKELLRQGGGRGGGGGRRKRVRRY